MDLLAAPPRRGYRRNYKGLLLRASPTRSGMWEWTIHDHPLILGTVGRTPVRILGARLDHGRARYRWLAVLILWVRADRYS